MRRFLWLATGAALWLAACAPAPISQTAATNSALAAISQLEQYHAKSVTPMPITGFTTVSSVVTTQTAAVPDGHGNTLNVSPAPIKAWVVIITAPPQGIW